VHSIFCHCFLLMLPPPPSSTLFPYTTLFRSVDGSSDSQSLIRVRGLNKTYSRGGEKIQVLQGLNLDVDKGDFVAFMGPSGSGKRSEEHTSELQSRSDLVCRLLLEKKKKKKTQ